MEAFWKTSLISGGSAAYLEQLYETYLEDPAQVEPGWRQYFDTLPRPNGSMISDTPHSKVIQYFAEQAKTNSHAFRKPAASVTSDLVHERKQAQVLHMIDAYRARGHRYAQVDPLALQPVPDVAALELRHYGLAETDLDTVFNTGGFDNLENGSLGDIVDALKQTYCGNIGIEYMHVSNDDERYFIRQRIESTRGQPDYSDEAKKRLLEGLTVADGLEKYLHTRYVGQKRFSLEGGDSLIPMLDTMVHRAGGQGVKEIIMGMAHRGRLNVLVNILGKAPMSLFGEFEGKPTDTKSSGDVKYHQGFSSNIQTSGGPVHLALAFNPSHLEIVSPVVEGSVLARQDRHQDKEKKRILPIVMHGDAAFAGQGVVMETLSMSQTRGFSTGGTVHIVINNQVGFTTSHPEDARSSYYCTDIAKMIEAPVFHVNADDPEAVQFISELALDYRMTFNKDVVIDLVCYRRHGHNEADEPSATQPKMYKKIKALPSPRELYAQKLIEEGVLTQEEADALVADFHKALDEGQTVVEEMVDTPPGFRVDWHRYVGVDWTAGGDTRVDTVTLKRLAEKAAQYPDTFTLQNQVKKVIADRHKMTAGKLALNWGYAETLAYATLLQQGYSVRLVGQDSGRGTFAHRHAVLHDQENNDGFIPLQHIAEEQGKFTVIDSLLSEEAVLAFEYGYATTEPDALVIWEAQFGDFANGAQVVIDQFISSGEQKWGRLSGLVMFLPHGYEGLGPEHSSARLERYLQLCAEHNIQVCTPTTPAQVFHMLRRQILRPYRKPLVVMTPKSLLRHKLAVSSLEDLSEGQFHTVIPEIDEDIEASSVTRVILCGGKVYYDLLNKRRELDRKDIAIIRLEQLYPFPEEDLTALLAEYSHVETIIWCQEEPKNQGAWYNTQHHMRACFQPGQILTYAGRPPSASPAAGFMALHVEQQKKLVSDALGLSAEQ